MRSDRFILIIKFKKRICAEVPVSPVSGGFSRTRFSLHNGLSAIFCEDCSACCRFAGRSFSIMLIRTYGSFVGRSDRPTSCSVQDCRYETSSGYFGGWSCFRPIRTEKMFTTVAGMRKRRCGGIFRRGAVRPDGAVGYRRVPVSLALFLVPYPEPALACSGKRNHFVKPSAIEFTRIVEARNGAWKWRNHRGFPWGGRRPRLFVGAGPFTSPECRPDRDSDFGNDGLSSLKGLYFFSVRSGSIYCISCDWRFISAIFKSDIFKRLFIL